MRMLNQNVEWESLMRILEENDEWDFIITKTLKYCNIFQHWRIIELPGPRDADASKNEYLNCCWGCLGMGGGTNQKCPKMLNMAL